LLPSCKGEMPIQIDDMQLSG